MERGEQPRPEDFRQARGIVMDVRELPTKDGKKTYSVVELDNGTKLRVFDKKKVAGLGIGMEIDYTQRKNDKGYWNVESLTPTPETELFPDKPEVTPEVTRTETPAPAPARPMVESLERASEMRVMNALTASSTVVSTMITKNLLQPKTLHEAFDMIAQMHEWMLTLGQPKPNA